MTKKKRITLGVAAILLAFTLNSQTYSQDYAENTSSLISFEELKDEITIYPGRVSLNNGTGTIYSIADVGAYQLKLNLIAKEEVILEEGKDLFLEFYPVTNYSGFIKNWSVEIYDARDRRKLNPLQVINGDETLDMNIPISTKIAGGMLDSLNPVTDLMYIMKVYDEKGKMDETELGFVHIDRNEKEEFEANKFMKEQDSFKDKLANARDNRRVKNIVLLGANVKILGSGLGNYKKVAINGVEREIDLEETFSYDNYLGAGDTIIPVELIDQDGKKFLHNIEVSIPTRYDFLIGLADITVGKNNTSGNQDILNPNSLYRENFFKTGRLAFYYRGLVDKYRITAHADTYEQELENMFKDFTRRDPSYYYRKLEYDPIEFNYGDDSVLYSDVDTQGKMYLRVDWDKNTVLWGNYNTGFTGTKYGEYNRTLYGARAEFNTLENNKFGESKHHLSLFGANPDSVYAHDELLGTGGSFYYMSYRDIVVGSAKLSVQVKDPTTGRILGRVELQEGTDYSINETQGLIRLTRPLSIIIPERVGKDIVSEQPLSGYLNFLVVDYEYYSRKIDMDSNIGGIRGKSWIHDNVALGGTVVDTNSGEHQYTLTAGDLTLKKSEGTFLRGEVAQSKGDAVYENSISINGGLDFFDREVGYDRGKKGDAYLVEGSLALMDISERFTPRDVFTFWYDRKNRGFSSANDRASLERENYGITGEHQVTDRLFLTIEHENYKENEINTTTETEQTTAGAEYVLNEKVTLGGEILQIESSGKLLDDSGINREADNGKATIVGAKAEYKITPDKKVYTKGQITADKSGGYKTNNSVSVGTAMSVSEKLRLDGELTTGTRGNGADVGVAYSVNDKHELYSKYSVLNDNGGNDGVFTVGQSAMMTDRTRIYHENQFLRGYGGKGFTGGYGVDYQKNEHLWLGALYQGGELNVDRGTIKKDSMTLEAKFEKKGFNMRNTLEYSRTRGEGDETDIDSWGTANRFKKVINDEYTLFGVGNFLDGKNKSTGETEARNAELGLGTAYRPIWNDKLNFIGKYSYIYDLGSLGQLNTNFGEKAHVLSLNTIYEISEKWDIGFKYAYRQEKVRVDRDSGPWFASSLDLFAVRLNYELIRKWDLFGEYHWLRNITDDQIKHGAMVGVYRELNDNLQLGVGYNFTQFDDDLTRLDYKSKGWFINLIGKF
ncbi:MAG: hypothetical protein ACRCTS_01035 [Fusobacteriaceae bacterium]